VPAAEIEERVHRTLGVAGLVKLRASYPGQLSGGQQQRVALARALVANEGLILFDEPLSNLDAKVRERLRDELIGMQQQFGFTGLYVTHDQVEAAALATRIAVMEVGRGWRSLARQRMSSTHRPHAMSPTSSVLRMS